MRDINLFIIAKALHILSVVIWIGGVSFVTTVLIPSIKSHSKTTNKIDLFVEVEGKFSLQAKILTSITGITGIYMLYFLNAWNRFLMIDYWWMHLMVIIWIIFFIVLFILEPLFLHRWFEEIAKTNDLKSLKRLQLIHIILLSVNILVILCAAAGANGFSF